MIDPYEEEEQARRKDQASGLDELRVVVGKPSPDDPDKLIAAKELKGEAALAAITKGLPPGIDAALEKLLRGLFS
jgi:hypothetical protein